MKNETSNESVYDITIRMFIMLLIVGWCLLLMYPFVSVILWSLILALALYPLHTSLSKKMGGKPKLASFIIVASILIIVILPTFLMVGSLIAEVKQLKLSHDNGTLTIPPPTEKVKDWPVIGENFYNTWKKVSDNIGQVVVQHKEQIESFGKVIGGGILSATSGVFQILLSLIIAGVILVFGGAGEEIRKFFRKVAGKKGDEFADLTFKTISSVVKGVLGESFVMAVLFGIVFLLAGVPYAGLWSLVVFIFAVVQIPTLIVTICMIIYFFAVKETMPAIIWSVILFVVGFMDNILTPLMLGKGAPVPMVIIFIGVIGGFVLSGFIGLFTGAIIMSIGYKLFIEWINSNEAQSESVE